MLKQQLSGNEAGGRSLDAAEVEKFERMAAEWWDPHGLFKPLHRMNPVRLDYIVRQISGRFGRDPRGERPFAGLRLLDIGCGGGLLSEPMRRLGFEVFDVVGHDRGGRVGYRMALDRPQAVRRLTVMDVVPTGEVWARADDRFALGYWHWAFLAQPHPIPERLIERDPEFFFFDAEFGGAIRGFPPAAVADYARCARDPAAIEAMCEDYRAGATCDRQWDDEDRAAGRRITCPTQVLWAGRGALAAWYDTLAIWRDWADDVSGRALDGGHFLVEECPTETLAAIRGFHAGDRVAGGSPVTS